MARKKKTTGKDLGTAEVNPKDLAPLDTSSVTDAEVDNFDLDCHMIKLLWDEPFFSHIMRCVTKVRTLEIPTAGVLVRDGDIKMWWNPRFLASLTIKQVQGLLKHECFHLVFEHTTTRRHEPHIVWNYATDLAINSLIPEEELPEGGLIPGQAFKKLTDKQLAMPWKPGALDARETVSQKIASFPKGQSSEWYFTQLMEIAKEIEQSNQGLEGEPGMPGDGPGSPGESGQNGMPGGTFDDHSGWDKMSDEERDLARGQIRQAVTDAIRRSDSSGKWGSVSSELRATLRELISGEVPWQSILKQFCGYSRRADRESSHKRLNRKYMGIHPGSKRSYTSSIAIYIDQSGSVGDDDLELFFGELMSLTKHTEFTLFNFDTEVDTKSERVWTRTKSPGLSRTRCGGTDFSAPSKHAKENTHRFDGYIIMSDGEAADPGPSRGIRRAWVICPGRKLLFDAPASDIVISMKGKAATAKAA